MWCCYLLRGRVGTEHGSEAYGRVAYLEISPLTARVATEPRRTVRGKLLAFTTINFI